MFETILQGQNERARRKRTVLVSFAIHVLVLGVLVVIPLIYYQTIPGGWEEIAKVFAAELPDPVPPSPPPPASPTPASGPKIPADRPVILLFPNLIEPGNVPPPDNAEVIEMPLFPFGDGPVGPPGSLVPDGVLNSPTRLNLLPTTGPKTPPPPPKPPKRPMLISTLDPSRVIYRVEPVYPPLALQARVQGSVMLQVTVNEMGIIESVEIVSGHPLLRQAAVEAVRQWRYKPTILNGEPVPVKATVTVNFNFRR